MDDTVLSNHRIEKKEFIVDSFLFTMKINFNAQELEMIRLYEEQKNRDKNMQGSSTILRISSISQGEVIIGSDMNKQQKKRKERTCKYAFAYTINGT